MRRQVLLTRVGAVPRHGGEHVLFYFGLAVFGLSSLLWSLPAGVLHRLLPRRLGGPLGQFMIMAGFRYFLAVMKLLGLFRCELGAIDALRRQGALIIAPNHPSLLDAVLVISRLPQVMCIAKASLWDSLLLGGGIRLAGYLRNDVPLALVKSAVAELRAGRQLLVFPEGTRSGDGAAGPFKGGFALMAKQANVPVQTVFLDVSPRYLGKGSAWFRKPALPIVCRARLGQQFEVAGDVHAFVAALEGYYRQQLGQFGP